MQNNIICLDAEFADNEEILELSIFNGGGQEIYHKFYNPEKIRSWRTDIHHITPEMVASEKPFSISISEIERIISSAEVIVGFAVDNDIRVLKKNGIKGLDSYRIADVKDFFWYLRGMKNGMSPFSVPSLISCANELGINFNEYEAHSASNDTLNTLKCFDILVSEFRRPDHLSIIEVVDELILNYTDAKEDFVRRSSSGYVSVVSLQGYFKIKFTNRSDKENPNLVFETKVTDRFKAEYELRKKLKKREIAHKLSSYRLSASQLDEIRNYSNEYDAEESAWCKKIVRNLSRLSL